MYTSYKSIINIHLAISPIVSIDMFQSHRHFKFKGFSKTTQKKKSRTSRISNHFTILKSFQVKLKNQERLTDILKKEEKYLVGNGLMGSGVIIVKSIKSGHRRHRRSGEK